MEPTGGWVAGERVVLQWGWYRPRKVATIDRVTPSGLACIGDAKFHPNGNRRISGRTQGRIWRDEDDQLSLIESGDDPHNKRMRVADAMRSAKCANLTEDQCNTILAILDTETK